MRRFLVPHARPGELLDLPQRESAHARRVLRMKPGDTLALFDGRGHEWRAEIADVNDIVRVRVLELRPASSGLDITIASACPKGKRLDWLVQKLSELGASRFQPVRFKRSTVTMTEAKIARLQRIAAEASKQCGRADTLEILPETALDQLPPPTFVADPEAATPLFAVARRPASILIGPEGGLTEPERVELETQQTRAVRLGPHVLRIETAAIAAAAILAAWESPI